MLEVKESKQGANFRFGLYGQRLSEPHSGQIHLFEHHYNDRFSFWWGVAEVVCDQAEILRLAAKSPGLFVVAVSLSDGRTAVARQVDMHADHTAPGSIMTIALFGDKPLRGAPERV
jgi:hypothetical protein